MAAPEHPGLEDRGPTPPKSQSTPPQYTSHEAAPRPRSRARLWIPLITLGLLIAALVLPPLININRYHRRIADSIGNAIGRPVHMSSVKLVMLPRPGFELSGFVVDENPAFGAEPMLRSSSVVASVRLGSLWRGRLEIARIRLIEPSLNLVRNPGGQWNFATVLVQAARTPNAPTAQKHAGSAPRFPYIEASNARINFKFGDEKGPFSFVGADLSAWLANPDEWQLRFEAQPVRTDVALTLADTGTVRVQGSLRRAPALARMPLDLTAEWSGASLGEVSRLLTGDDPGWRGTLDLQAAITGDPANALIRARVRGSSIHRIEFEPESALDIEATCELHYLHAQQAIEGLTCLAPAGSGQILLTGAIHNVATSPQPSLALELKELPVAFLLHGLQVLRRNFPPGIRATGSLAGRFNYDPGDATPFTGQASIARLALATDDSKQPLVVTNLTLSSRPNAPAVQPRKASRHPSGARVLHPALHAAEGLATVQETGPSLRLSEVSLAASGDPPLTLNASFAAGGFELHIVGTAPVSHLIELNRGLNLVPAHLNGLGPQGTADLNLSVLGTWLPPLSSHAPLGASSGPVSRIEGSLRLRNTQLATGFLALPLQIVSADGVFSGDQVSGNQVIWQPVEIAYGTVHAAGSLQGPVTIPADCADPDACTRRFDLHLDSLDLGTLQKTLLGSRRGQFLDEIISRLSERRPAWPPLAGTLHIDNLTVNTLTIHHAFASLRAGGNALAIEKLSGQALGGELRVTGSMDASGSLPAYSLDIGLSGGDATQAAALFHEQLGTGSLDWNAHLHLSGYTSAQLSASAAGKFHAEWTGHSRGNSAATGDGPTVLDRFASWIGDGVIAERSLALTDSVLTPLVNSDLPPPPTRGRHHSLATPGAAQPVRLAGSISFARELSLHGGTGDQAFNIGGTLEHPTLIAPVATTKPGTSRGVSR